MINSQEMTKEEVQKFVGKLADDAKIIMVTSKSQIPIFLLTHAETLAVGQRVFKYLRNSLGAVTAVWIFMLTLFPEITPTPLQTYKIVYDHAPQMIAAIDFSFPYSLPDTQKPWVLFPGILPDGQKMPEANYYVSGSGIAPNLFS
jgi:hypothetical protein